MHFSTQHNRLVSLGKAQWFDSQAELSTLRGQHFKRMTYKHDYPDSGVWYPYSKGKIEEVSIFYVKNSSFQAKIRVLENLCDHRGWTFLMSLVVTLIVIF